MRDAVVGVFDRRESEPLQMLLLFPWGKQRCSHCSALVSFRNRFERDLYTRSFLFHNYISSCWYPNTRFIFHGIACIKALRDLSNSTRV